MCKIGISSVAFKKKEEIEYFHKETGTPIEYSVNLLPGDVRYLIKNKVKCLSVHIPSPTRDYFPNFASNDKSILNKSMDILKESMDTLSRCEGEILVIHPGYVLNALVPSDSRKRKQFIHNAKKEFEGYLIDKSSLTIDRDYLESPFYKRHFDILSENILRYIEYVKNQGFTLVLENLNPTLFYLLQLPEEVAYLSQLSKDVRFCLDFAHLYISSLVHGFSFQEGIDKILMTQKVLHLHISNNPSKKGYYQDRHDHINRGNIDYSKILPLIPNRNLNFVLEVIHDPKEDLSLLKNLLDRE